MAMKITRDEIISIILIGVGLGLLLEKGEEYMSGDMLIKWFLKKYKNAFKRVANKFGYDPLILMAHALHESRRRRNDISGLAKKYNNFFGIKCHKNYKSCIYLITHEYRFSKEYPDTSYFRNAKLIGKTKNGQYEFVGEAPFKRYDSVEQGLEDYIKLIKKYYPEAYRNRTNPEQYFEGLFHGKKYSNGKYRKYSTTRKSVYVKSCMKLYNKLFSEYNREVTNEVS